MQAAIVTEGNPLSFNFLAFPEQHQATLQYLENQFTNISNTLTDAGRRFVETSRAIYQREHDVGLIAKAKALVRTAKNIFHPNTIVPLNTLEEIRSAQPIMQRYIMSFPELRKLYFSQRIDGYSDTYADVEPGRIGPGHYDYRRATNGMIMDEVDEDGHYRWRVSQYMEELRYGDRELTFTEKADILSTWDVIKMYLDHAVDPTNVYE